MATASTRLLLLRRSIPSQTTRVVTRRFTQDRNEEFLHLSNHERFVEQQRSVGMAGTAAAALLAFAAMKQVFIDRNEDNNNDGNEDNENDKSANGIVVPTMEALARSIRLASTAGMVVMDYKLASLKTNLFPEADKEHAKLEQEKEMWAERLDEAQTKYTTPKTEEDAAKNGMTRAEMVRQEREAVHNAAEQLAAAEEKLAEVGDKKSEVHKQAAERLLQLCRTNGGTYIKIGQHLANLDYLIPKEYVEVLSSLFDAAPQSPYSDVAAVIKEELGASPDELFDGFEKEPIASASLAQVHVAYDKTTGRKLAVKVQHRGLRETSVGDLFALTKTVEVLDRVFTDFTWAWISDEIAPQLPKELDFANEGKNAEKAAQFVAEANLNCTVPKILWENTSSRVLCMEFEEGFKVTDLESIEKAGLNKKDVARLVSSVFNSQVFQSGWVHCDPHPANVLIRPDRNGKPHMVLVDHGLYKAIDDDFRIEYAQLWKALMLADLKGIRESCHRLGVDEMYTLLAAMLTSRPYDEMMERAKTGSLSATLATNSKADKALIAGYASKFLQEIFVVLGSIPRQMLLLLKMNDCLRHIDYALGSPTNTLVVAGKHASKAVLVDRIRNGASLRDRIVAMLDYAKVLFRIQIHDLAVWWKDVVGSSVRETLLDGTS